MRRINGFYIKDDELYIIHFRSPGLLFRVEPDFPNPGVEDDGSTLICVGYDWNGVISNLVKGASQHRILEWADYVSTITKQVVKDLDNYHLDLLDYEDYIDEERIDDDDYVPPVLSWTEEIAKQAVYYIIEYLIDSEWIKRRDIREQIINLSVAQVSTFDIEFIKKLITTHFSYRFTPETPQIWHIAEFIAHGLKVIRQQVMDNVLDMEEEDEEDSGQQ